ncbi:MAG: hypothetical protein RIQ63_1210 [Actinomycetota bacterium]
MNLSPQASTTSPTDERRGSVRIETSLQMIQMVITACASSGRMPQAVAHHIPAKLRAPRWSYEHIRSHAAGGGTPYSDEIARAAMVVRAHQLAQPGSGIRVDVVRALVDALIANKTSAFREFGGLGTGDITVLGELATCLVGERQWSDGTMQKFIEDFDASAALSFMSSSAPTLGLGAHALHRLEAVVRASLVAATLSTVPIRANRQQWSEVAQGTRPSDGVSECMTVIRRLLDGTDYIQARTQDPLAYRVMPFVFGPLIESLWRAKDETNRAIDARAENPRFAHGAVWHHGAFNLTSVGLAFDTLRLSSMTPHIRIWNASSPSVLREALG